MYASPQNESNNLSPLVNCSMNSPLQEAGQLLQDGRAGRSRGGDPGASEPADVHF